MATSRIAAVSSNADRLMVTLSIQQNKKETPLLRVGFQLNSKKNYFFSSKFWKV